MFTVLVKGGTVAVLVRADVECTRGGGAAAPDGGRAPCGPVRSRPLRRGLPPLLPPLSRARAPARRGVRDRRGRVHLRGAHQLLRGDGAGPVRRLDGRRLHDLHRARPRRSRSSTCLYLLTQLVVASENCSVRVAAARVGRFLSLEHRRIAMVFAVMLVVVGLATMASILATAGLGIHRVHPDRRPHGPAVAAGGLAGSRSHLPIPRPDRAQRVRTAVSRHAAHQRFGRRAGSLPWCPGALDELRRLLVTRRGDDAGIGHPEDGRRDAPACRT